jgi:hypothetical protein
MSNGTSPRRKCGAARPGHQTLSAATRSSAGYSFRLKMICAPLLAVSPTLRFVLGLAAATDEIRLGRSSRQMATPNRPAFVSHRITSNLTLS